MLKIMISPAKKMNMIDEYTCRLTSPVFQEKARQLHDAMLSLSLEELKKLWNCSEKLALQNYGRLHTCEPGKNLTPALLAYEGIQYQYMAPHIFSNSQWEYAEKHLRILSGFYGILRPTDGVIPYRLEMQAKPAPPGRIFGPADSLYEYWGDSIYRYLAGETCSDKASSLNVSAEPDRSRTSSLSLSADRCGKNDSLQIVNLASAEYSKIILPYITPPATQVSCIFGEWIDGRIKVKGTLAKMARGEMVRWMAENQIEDVHELQEFHHLNYLYHKELSSDTEYVFLKENSGKD